MVHQREILDGVQVVSSPFSSCDPSSGSSAPPVIGRLHSRQNDLSARIAELSVPLSEAGSDLVRIGNERTTKPKHVRRTGGSLLRSSLRD